MIYARIYTSSWLLRGRRAAGNTKKRVGKHTHLACGRSLSNMVLIPLGQREGGKQSWHYRGASFIVWMDWLLHFSGQFWALRKVKRSTY